MNSEPQQIEELIAKRLADKTDFHMPKKRVPEKQTMIMQSPQLADLAPSEFVKVEKNLNSLGFFTPSSKTTRDAKAKTISFTRMIEGKKVEAKVTIAPTAIYGLPVTADQDKYLALQKIITDIRQEKGVVENPIGFTSAQILRLLGQADAGKNYTDIHEWMKRMTATTIISEGAVYLAGRKKWAQDSFHVFDRSITVGQELQDGTVADQNYVWLSEWQLENINSNHLLPIDFEAYKKLRSHIAKALVPMLQIWLYASVEKGSFEKRYDELCQYLNIKEYKHLSKIVEKLGPALDELKSYGYISKWKIEHTSDRKAFKMILSHGEKYHRDRRQRLGQGEGGDAGPESKTPDRLLSEEQQTWIATLVEKGVLANAAQELIISLPANQPIADQLEWIAEQVKQLGDKIKNPPGFIIHMLKGNVPIPEDFITSRKQEEIRVARAAVEKAYCQQLEIEAAYTTYQGSVYQQYLAEELESADYLQIVEEEKKKIKQKFKGDLFRDRHWTENGIYDEMAKSAVKRQLMGEISCMEFEEFKQQYLTDSAFAAEHMPRFDDQA